MQRPPLSATPVIQSCPESTGAQPRGRRRALQLTHRRPCPHCGSGHNQGHGSFAQKDGTRQPRRLCLNCGRTFSQNTGTPVHYLKKRGEWDQMAGKMVERLSVRGMAAALHVQVATAFRWRHRLLSALERQAQPVLTGSVAACEAFVPYSEKGNRYTDAPGARYSQGPIWAPQGTAGRRCPYLPGGLYGGRPFRRLSDGKAHCILLAGAGEQQVVAIAGRGRLLPEELQSCLSRVVGTGAELWSLGIDHCAEACRRLSISHRAGWLMPPLSGVDGLRRDLYSWCRRFRRVASRYLSNYLAWFRFAVQAARLEPEEVGRQLLAETSAVVGLRATSE